jgi:hypothetical protein
MFADNSNGVCPSHTQYGLQRDYDAHSGRPAVAFRQFKIHRFEQEEDVMCLSAKSGRAIGISYLEPNRQSPARQLASDQVPPLTFK